jgi:hypothetical protein
MNTRRVGAIVSGPIIAIGTLTVLGERGIFVREGIPTPQAPTGSVSTPTARRSGSPETQTVTAPG